MLVIKRIDVGSVGEWIGDFAIDRISLLREYKLAAQYEDQDCQHQTQK